MSSINVSIPKHSSIKLDKNEYQLWEPLFSNKRVVAYSGFSQTGDTLFQFLQLEDLLYSDVFKTRPNWAGRGISRAYVSSWETIGLKNNGQRPTRIRRLRTRVCSTRWRRLYQFCHHWRPFTTSKSPTRWWTDHNFDLEVFSICIVYFKNHFVCNNIPLHGWNNAKIYYRFSYTFRDP